jgi:hypothetical protein
MNRKHIPILIIGLFVVSGLLYVLIGGIVRKRPVLVKETTEYVYYKQYSIYNKDSCVYKYHKPIIYDGKVVRRRRNFVGLPGKGGHYAYRTHIMYNNTEECIKAGFIYYDEHKEGDDVKVKVTFYPYEKVETLN